MSLSIFFAFFALLFIVYSENYKITDFPNRLDISIKLYESDIIDAVSIDDFDKVKILLAKGVNVNAKNNRGDSALALALSKFRTDHGDRRGVPIAILLIEHGADVNTSYHTFSETFPVLIEALQCRSVTAKEYIRLITLLLKRGADINCQDSNGRTPLMYAERSDIFRLLLTHGADTNAHDKNGKSLLMRIAERRSNNRTVSEILKMVSDKGLDVNEKDNDGMTALMLAGLADNVPCANWLISRGAEINVMCSGFYGWTPLMWAIQRGGTKAIVQVFLSNGANIHYRDKFGWNATQMASEQNRKLAVLRLLLAKQDDVEQIGVQGDSLLMHACGATAIENAQYLWKRGAKINRQDKYGQTPLMWAILRKRETEPKFGGEYRLSGDSIPTLTLAQWLVDHGARIEIKDEKNQRAIDIAKEDDQSLLVAFLREK